MKAAKALRALAAIRASLIEGSASPVPANEHRVGHSQAADFARWGHPTLIEDFTRHALLSDQIVAELGGDPLEGDEQEYIGQRPIEEW